MGGDLSMTLHRAGDSGREGRILRPPGDSWNPSVVLRTDTRAAPHKLAKDRKFQGPKTPTWQAGNSGQEMSCSKETMPFLPFLVKDARGKNMSITLQHLASY